MAIFSIFRPNMGFQLNDFSVAIESPDKAPEQINENPAMIRKESTIITKN